MEISVGEQAVSLLGSLALGCCIGVLYDVLRILRVRCRRRTLSGLFDFFFWMASIPALVFYALITGDGQIRIYILLGVALGVGVHFLLFSRLVLFLGYKIADFIGLIFHILTRPLVWIWCILKKIQEKLKNVFLSWGRWYKMKRITRKTDTSNKSICPDKGGGEHEIQTSGIPNETDCFDTTGLYGCLSSDVAGSDCICPSTRGRSDRASSRVEAKKRRFTKRHRKQR
jgi:spore cortex biosynthesis protein YabQ